MEKLDLAPKRGLRSGSETCQRCDCVELLTDVLAHRGKENPAKMQSKVHELSHISSCFIYLPPLFLSAFPLLLSAPMVQRYSALCRLKASGCLVELWKATSYLFFYGLAAHICDPCVYLHSYVGAFEKKSYVDLLISCCRLFRETQDKHDVTTFSEQTWFAFSSQDSWGKLWVTHAWKHAFACWDDIRFLEAGLSGRVLYQQIRREVEKFLCPFLQKN